jgi:hypothetical protein
VAVNESVVSSACADDGWTADEAMIANSRSVCMGWTIDERFTHLDLSRRGIRDADPRPSVHLQRMSVRFHRDTTDREA